MPKIGPENLIGVGVKMWANLGGIPKGEPLIQAREHLSKRQLDRVGETLGTRLGKVIHSREGKGYGWIFEDFHDPGSYGRLLAIPLRGYRAPHNSWYVFLTNVFDSHTQIMEQEQGKEARNGRFSTELSNEQRQLMNEVWQKRPLVRELPEQRRGWLAEVAPNLLNGNLSFENIHVDSQARFRGLIDYRQLMLGDPVNDLAYLSVMPEGEKIISAVTRGWETVRTRPDNFEERYHLYRLWESYRKILTRYVRHHYLGDRPEPLAVAKQELTRFGIS